MSEADAGPLFSLQGTVALVTGSGSGIGEQIARLFARQGAAVVVGDIDEAAGTRVASAIRAAGGRAHFHRLDVTSMASATAAVEACQAVYGALNTLVNNAGIGFVGDLLETDEASFDRLMNVNVKGVFLCSKAVAAHMAEHGGGTIVNIASVAGQVAVKRRFAYGATKGAVIAMTRSMAIDLLDRHIRVNCICPGTVHTPFVDGFINRFHADTREQTLAEMHARQPIGRMGRPDEVAYAALYLAAPESQFAIGTALTLDGGWTAQ